MGVFVPCANCAQFELRITNQLELCENTLWVRDNLGWSGISMAVVAANLRTWWEDSIKPRVSTECKLTHIHFRDHTTANSAVSDLEFADVVGTRIEAALPMTNSFQINFKTGQAGRSRRGANRITGLLINDVDDGRLTATAHSAWLAAYEDLPAVLNVGTQQWVVVSRFSGKDANGKPIPRAAGVVTPITHVTAPNPAVASQKSRKPE